MPIRRGEVTEEATHPCYPHARLSVPPHICTESQTPMPEQQNYSNHGRLDPKVHFLLMPVAFACFISSILHLIKQHSPANVLLVPVTFCLLLLVPTVRMYSLKVQDRVIRLEETLRMEKLGVSPTGLTVRQFVALRFASDAELPALTERARTENLTGKQIKQAITHWRADNDRV